MKTVALEDICVFKNGRGFKKSEWREQGLPIIRIQNLNNFDAPFNYYQGEYDKAIEVNSGDLLFSWSGTIGSSFGAHIWERETGVLNQHIFKVHLSDSVDKRFAYHALQWITAEIEKKVNGAVGLVHITKAKLNKFEIPLPPLPEQKRIVAILDEAFAGIDAAVANTEKNLANARELFESYLNAVFTQKGDGWVEKKLGDVCRFENGDRGKNYPGRKAFVPKGIPFINAGHLDDGVIDWQGMDYIPRDRFDLLGNGKVQKRDLLFCLRGSLGKFGIVDRDIEGAIASSLVIVRPDIQLDCHYLAAYFRSALCENMIAKYANGAAQPNLSAKSLKAFEIPLPPTSEQKQIVEKLDGLFSETSSLEGIYQQKLEALAELKQSILQKAFAGELTTLPDKQIEEAVA